MTALEERIASLDVSLFETIDVQLGDDDIRSLLALHAGCRRAYGSFEYLEIGSHLGGSLQLAVVDPACTRIVSIDARPPAQPDARGIVFEYLGNTTERMLEELRRVPGAELAKLHTIDASTEQLDPAAIPGAPRLCFVDGEHTDEAALRDARFCRAVLHDEGCVLFHDAHVVYGGIGAFLAELERDAVEHHALYLPTVMFAVELGRRRVTNAPEAIARALESGRGYLETLGETDVYRRFYRRALRQRAREAARAVRRSYRLLRRR